METMSAITVPELEACRAVVFDTDGVITDSAPAHAAAWKAAFDPVCREHGQPPFDPGEDYRRYVDGKSRLDGAASFLTQRGIGLPFGDPDDPPGTGSVCAVAARKEEEFLRRLTDGSVDAWPGTVRLLHALYEERVPCAAVSSSRHARDLLAHTGVRTLFQTVVDGNDAAHLALRGKPDPALFLEGARRLGVPPDASAVVEDALAGVEAGRRGDFSFVIGVDRAHTATSAGDLRDHGADLVVTDLGELLAPDDGGR
ncbi:haloacid dehalogenase superfamily, subfamily IA, variant 3 with third motif having DD or ED [Streptomyces harbinensis]|uniref:Haloacid dehalogenase superfamily, subfamily IA, variant 3 with third motif having DD or ED n=2 Tax=Streptomyces TaxID=1883 RepID=A0A1I6RGB7_9ACTN|nr:haloacid dehalogenase superfamily, subfamily IA, variant 3 with third motif having DD or ED [Streptomyces harbinensis]